MNYRIGLDIGIASVGFAVMETDNKGEPVKIKDLGVRIFEKAETPKEGSSLAKARRDARGLRRRLRRRVHRRERTEKLLQEYFGSGILEKIALCNADIFELRNKGISAVLSEEELGKILLYFVKHRGFLSNRKSDAEDKEGGKLLKATSANNLYLIQKGYRTVGEMLFKDERYHKIVIDKVGNKRIEYLVRNKKESYDNTFLRADLKEELIIILEKQTEGGVITKDFIEKYIKIFWTNRNYDEGPGEPSKYRGGYAVGNCPFIKDELRAPKSSYTFEYCKALERLNNLKINENGKTRKLTENEREIVFEEIKKRSEIKFSSLKKRLNLNADATFNLLSYSPKKTVEETEKANNFASLTNSYKIKKCLTENNANNTDIIDKIAFILSMNKSDDKRLEELKKISCLSGAEKEALLMLNFKGFGGTSIKFLKEIQPFLEKGLKYSEACAQTGYNYSAHSCGEKSKLLDTKEVYEQVQDIAVPVVKRAVSQTIRVVNAIIRKYGSPIAINIELARELSKTRDERDQIKKENEEREKNNERIKERLETEFGIISPSGQDILKLRLYEEQGCKSAYSQAPFEITRLFDSNYAQIDHIIPYSKSFDDSFNNKVLVFTKENQDKKDRIPYEYLGSDINHWTAFETFVSEQYKSNKNKRERLLKKEFTEDDAKEWKERNLNDTKYITSFVYNLLNDNLTFAGNNKKNVFAVNGHITSYMRKILGLTKDRGESDKHHALDAAVVACVTDSEIQKITKFNKYKEDINSLVKETVNSDGEIVRKAIVEPPYNGFREELLCRLANDPKYYTAFFIKQGYTDKEINELRPVFVSRMVNKKSKGVIHDATLLSAKIYNDVGEDHCKVIKRVPLAKLHLVKDKEGNYSIDNYYNPESDKLLYNKLLSMLIENNGNSKIAFKNPVYKPKSDGTDGALVSKVKIKEKITLGVKLNKVNAIAGNGDMIRIDIFTKNGKYYTVPVYVKDAYAGVLPNKAATASKLYEEWTEIDNTYEFLFSLYKNDLVYIEHKSGLKLTKTNSKNKNDTIDFKKGFLYYNSFNISNATATMFNIENSYEIGGAGLTTLTCFKKCQADLFGNITFINKEKRQGFNGVY